MPSYFTAKERILRCIKELAASNDRTVTTAWPLVGPKSTGFQHTGPDYLSKQEENQGCGEIVSTNLLPFLMLQLCRSSQQ